MQTFGKAQKASQRDATTLQKGCPRKNRPKADLKGEAMDGEEQAEAKG